MSDHRFPPLRAVLRNAATWGAAWALAGGAIVSAIALFDPNPAIESLPERVGMALLAGVTWGVRFAIVGAVVGALFSVVIRLRYRGRRLAEISPAPFARLGAVVGGVGVPLFLQTMNVLSGDGPVAWRLVADDGVWAAGFGAGAAAGSILIARRADARGAGRDELERGHDPDALPAAGEREVPVEQRSRSAGS